MKIEKIILENFAAIKNAQDTNRLEIDFTKSNNKICIIIGRNGDGKTTLMSLLNPFADVGNLDVRSTLNLILENKDGYKEIHIRNDKDLYIIKHFYTHHKDKSHSVKSYIEKNGLDLNPNGNVTSFKEMVKEELQIDMDYLKLIRLGDNVTNLINLSSTERKNYMSKIMVEVGIYLDYYKSVNQKMRQLNDMISHIVDKIKKLDILDKDILEDEINRLKKEIVDIDNLYDEENTLSGKYKERIASLNPDNDIKDRLDSITKRYNKMKKIMDKDDLSNKDLKTVIKECEAIDKKLIKLNTTLDANKILITNFLNQLDNYQSQLSSLKTQRVKEEESDKELELMNKNIINMRKRINEYEDVIKDFIPTITKADLEKFILELRNIQDILERTYEFGKEPVGKVVELMKKNKNVMQYINSHLMEIDERKHDNDSIFLSTLANRIKNLSITMNIVNDCKEESCPARLILSQVNALIENSEVDDKVKDVDFYKNMEYINQNIKSALTKFRAYQDTIDKLPDDIKGDFELKSIYKNISSLKPIYSEISLSELLSLTTEYENLVRLKEECENEESKLSKFSNLTATETASNIKKITKEIESLTDKLHQYTDDNNKISEEISDLTNDKEIAYDTKDALESFTEVSEEFNKLTNDYASYLEANDKLMESMRTSLTLKNKREQLTRESQEKQSKLSQYKELNKELEKYNTLYEDMGYIKNSLSSKEGIPLYIISHYLNNTETITNELLSIAYDNKIYIDNFNITPTEFTIPFYNNGVCLPDVKYASQGELSFLSIALSFALSSQALSKYNIMLLDEIDGPLDTINREKFIRILENQIDRIDSEQNFLITHNDMFSSYPVDIIDLSGRNNVDEYPMATFLDVVKG